MFKKFFCLALALVMIMSIAAVGFSAAQVEIAEVAADADAASTGSDADAASTGADADAASTSALDTGKCLNFDASTTGWNDFGKIGFYMAEVGGDEWKPWGSKALFASEETSSGVWSFDPEANGYPIESGKQYYVIFVNQNSGGQTANLLFDSSCLGDTAYCDGSTQENDVDSNKSSLVARWKNSSLGPMKVVTSIGNVVGETIPANTTAYEMLVNFLKNTLSNARTYVVDTGKKTEQQMIDDVVAALGLTDEDCTKAIAEAGVTVDWKASSSGGSSSGGSSSSSSSSGGSSSSSGSTSSGSSSSGSSSSSSTKSGSASNTQTGQEENILFIMLGVMVVAAGVIFFTRKRERA